MSKENTTKLLLTFAIGLVIWFIPAPAGLKPQAMHMIAVFVATIAGFIMAPLPIGALALISVGLAGFLGVMKPAEALSGFGNATIWLIVSAFIFAKGFSKTGLGRRIAYVIMSKIGGNSLFLAYTMAITDVIIAPATPSNTARGGGILFPIIRSLCSAFGSEPGETGKKIGRFLIASSFHVNCVTSSMFVTAVAPNLLCTVLAKQSIGVEITWGSWAVACIVPGILAVILVPLLVYKIETPEIKNTPEAKEIAKQELEAMGPMSTAEKIVALVFVAALGMWATSSITKLNATMIAMVCIGVMLIGHAVEWSDVITEKGAWDTLFWMGGLMSLAGGLNKCGAIKWAAGSIGKSMAGVDGMMALAILCVIYMYSHYLFASMSAHVAAMYAAFAAVAVACGAPAGLTAMCLAVITGIMGSLTHYATGTAPIFFGAGYLSQNEWWKIGFIVSVLTFIIFLGIGPIWWKVLGIW